MPLTDAKVRNSRAADRPYKMADGGGLHLYVPTSGARVWRVRVQIDGKEKLRTIGAYPAMTLAEARRAAAAALGHLQAGTKPDIGRDKLTLEAAARAWHATQAPRWKPHHAADVLASLAEEVFPALGDKPLSAVTAPMILAELRRVEARGAVDTAHRIRQRLAAVWAHAIASGHAKVNPAAGLERAMQAVVRQRHRPAMLDLDAARAMLTRAEAIPAHPVTRLALRLLALTAVRPGELRAAEWTEFSGLDGGEPTWTIPAARMKHTREHAAETPDHAVPLSTHAVDALAALHTLTGAGRLALPSLTAAHRPLSENAIGYLLNRAGYAGRHVPHGWRATFATVMNERHPADRAVIDLMLAHTPKDAVERAYNRARHTARRRELAQAWSDLLMAEMAPARDLLALPIR